MESPPLLHILLKAGCVIRVEYKLVYTQYSWDGFFLNESSYGLPVDLYLYRMRYFSILYPLYPEYQQP